MLNSVMKAGEGDGLTLQTSTLQTLTFQTLTLQTATCRVSILPALGGKIASIRFGDREVEGRKSEGHEVGGLELLQAPLAAYAGRTREMAFDLGDASGWDECLPSVANCSLRIDGREEEATIPDHGDLWRVPWRVIAHDEHVATLAAECFSLPLSLVRTATLTEENGRARLQLDYVLTNTGDVPIPWSWAAHPLFATDPGDRVRLPASIHTLRLEGSGRDRLGQSGARVNWPVADLLTGGQVDLSLALGVEAAVGDKLFAGPLRGDEGWCMLERPSAGLRLIVRFDPSVLPYLGLWLCAGGWPDRPGPKQVCAALEPTTAPVDSLAVAGPWRQTLPPGGQTCWQMSLEIERYDKVK